MPRYVYECEQCKDQKEIISTVSEMESLEPYCGYCGQNMTRIICPTSFILNGSGWAADGYGVKH